MAATGLLPPRACCGVATRACVIEGAQLLLRDAVEPGDLRMEEGVIAAVGGVDTRRADRIDGRGLVLAPAMVDLHGDAFERQVMPRPGVFFPLDAAILDTDRQLAGNGIATAYHALTLSWEPGLRSVGRAAAFIEALVALEGRLGVEHRLQLRWETFAFEALDLIDRALALPLTPAVAFNDHTSMALRSFDVPLQARGFEGAPDFATAALDDPRLRTRSASNARRAGLAVEDYLARLERVWARRPEVAGAIGRVAAAAAAAGAPMLSHDDTQPETRAIFRARGARIAEFAMNEATARAAREAGDAIVFGAPNVVRGGSHLGSPGAADMIEAGLCDILASDYFYPAMLAAVARLHAERRAPLPELWALVARNPAAALGLTDRGEIAPGCRADLVLLDWPEGGPPRPVVTVSRGRVVYRSEGPSR